jgi:SAM-dependent methyltransferase
MLYSDTMTAPPHQSRGLYAFLERPGVYERVQNVLGGRAARRRLVDEFIRPFRGARLLDVGCGTGTLLESLPEGVEYVGFDGNAAYVETARRRYGGRGAFLRATVGKDAIGFADGTFDRVVAVALLHHLDDADVDALLRSAARLLRPGGVFVSIDGAVHPRQSRLARMMLALDRGGRIRTPEEYRRLIGMHFPLLETSLLTDLLPIPYSHFVARGTRA